MLIGALTYTLHLISFPAGWSTLAADAFAGNFLARPPDAVMGANGAVAVLLANAASHYEDATRILIIRKNGTTTILQAESPAAERIFRAHFRSRNDCLTKGEDCPAFSNVTLARDGTPFATIQYRFDGAYMGVIEGAVKWEGAWNVVPSSKPFDGAGDPESPTNVRIAASDWPLDFAFNGDYGDHPGYDSMAPHPSDYYADVTAVHFGSRTIQLGPAAATGMRDHYVAGYYAGTGLMRSATIPPVAVRWSCILSSAAIHPCVRDELGRGVAFAVDSYGDVVGDDRPDFFSSSQARPVVWRDHRVFRLSPARGRAFAVAGDGTIVGWSDGEWIGCLRDRNRMGASAFIASARDARPRARPLDPLVRDRGGFHVEAAFGIADDGRILACVTRSPDPHAARSLAILMPG